MRYVHTITNAVATLEEIKGKVIEIQHKFHAGNVRPGTVGIEIKGLNPEFIEELKEWATAKNLMVKQNNQKLGRNDKWQFVTFKAVNCTIRNCNRVAEYRSDVSNDFLCEKHKKEEVEWMAANERYEEELEEAMAREDAMESRPDPVCVCGVSRSEHMLAGCEQFEARRN